VGTLELPKINHRIDRNHTRPTTKASAKHKTKFMANDIGLPHWGSDLCCGLCMADKAVNNFKDCRRCANWRPTTHTPLSFRARFLKPGIHMVMERMCSLTPCYWALDTLHITDYHGVASHVLGNVLHDIVRDNEYGLPTQAATFERSKSHRNQTLTLPATVWLVIWDGRESACFALPPAGFSLCVWHRSV
jgi:hypothetical protein